MRSSHRRSGRVCVMEWLAAISAVVLVSLWFTAVLMHHAEWFDRYQHGLSRLAFCLAVVVASAVTLVTHNVKLSFKVGIGASVIAGAPLLVNRQLPGGETLPQIATQTQRTIEIVGVVLILVTVILIWQCSDNWRARQEVLSRSDAGDSDSQVTLIRPQLPTRKAEEVPPSMGNVIDISRARRRNVGDTGTNQANRN